MATSRSGSRHSARPAGAVATGSLDGSSIFKVYCEGGKIFEFDFMHEMERPGGLQVLKEQFVDFLRAHALIPPGLESVVAAEVSFKSWTGGSAIDEISDFEPLLTQHSQARNLAASLRGITLKFQAERKLSANSSSKQVQSNTDMWSSMYASPDSPVEDFIDNSFSSTCSQETPLVKLTLDRIENSLSAVDNGSGAGPESDSAVIDLCGRGDASSQKTRIRDQAAYAAAQENCPESWLAMRQAIWSKWGFGLKIAAARLVMSVIGAMIFSSKMVGHSVENVWRTTKGSDEVTAVNADVDSDALERSGTTVKLENLDDSFWGAVQWQTDEDANAFLQDRAKRFAGTYFFMLFDIQDFAKKVLNCVGNLAGSQESVVTNAPFLKKNFKGRGDTKADLNTALRLLRGTIAETPLPKTWNLEVSLRYKDVKGAEQLMVCNCGDSMFRQSVYIDQVLEHAEAILPIFVPVTGIHPYTKQNLGGGSQLWVAYVSKDKVGYLEDAADRAGVAPRKEEWQVIWELKTLQVTAELGLVTMARNLQTYKADLENLDMSCVHVFLMVPRTFPAVHTKDALDATSMLFKGLRATLLAPDSNYASRVGHFLTQMVIEHEQKASIVHEGDALHTNGVDFKRNSLIRLTRQKGKAVPEHIKPFETVTLVLQDFSLDSHTSPQVPFEEAGASSSAAADPYRGDILLQVALPTGHNGRICESYNIPLQNFLVNQVHESDTQAEVSIQPDRILLVGRQTCEPTSRQSRQKGRSIPALEVMAGHTPVQVAQVFDSSSGSTKSSQRSLSFTTLRRQRWTVGAMEWRVEGGSESEWQQSSCVLSSAGENNKVCFGITSNQQGDTCFAVPGEYSMRLCLGQACFTEQLDNQQAGNSPSSNLPGTVQTIRGQEFKVKVTEPTLQHADSMIVRSHPKEIRRGTPVELQLIFKCGQQCVVPASSEIQTMHIHCEPELVSAAESALSRHAEEDADEVAWNLSGVFATDLGPAEVKIKVFLDADNDDPLLQASFPCTFIAGPPATVQVPAQPMSIVNASSASSISFSFNFNDSGGSQCQKCSADFQPSLLGPLAGKPSFEWSQDEEAYQVSFRAHAKSPLYDQAADIVAYGHSVIPVRRQMPDSASSANIAECSVGIGLLNEACTNIACILFVGDAIQYGPDGSRGLIQQIDWGVHAPSADLLEKNIFKSASTKVTVKKLQTDSDDPRYASIPNISARPTVVTVDNIQAQLHVLDRGQAETAFPDGLQHSHFGAFVAIASNGNSMEHAAVRSWDRTACLCMKLNEDKHPVSAICSFATIQVSPSCEPVQLRLLRTMLPQGQPLAAAEKALLKGIDQVGILECSAPAGSQVTDLAAAVLDEVGRPCRTSTDGSRKLKCQRSSVAIVTDKAVYELPNIKLQESNSTTTVKVSLITTHNNKVLFSAIFRATATPHGVSEEACLSLAPVPNPDSSSEDDEDTDENAKAVVCVGEQVHVVVNLKGTEEGGAVWQNAPDLFDLTGVKLGFTADSMVSAVVTDFTDRKGFKQFEASTSLSTRACAIGDQTLTMVGKVVARDAMDVDGGDGNQQAGGSQQVATESVTYAVHGSLPVTLDGGKAAGVRFQTPPTAATELAQQSFTVQLLGPEGHSTSLPENAKLFVQVGEERAELIASKQAGVGLYTCKHSLALMPGKHKVSIAGDGIDVVVVPEQENMELTIQASDFVTGIAVGSIQPTAVTAGERVTVPVQVATHNGEPLHATDEDISNMCTMKLGPKAFLRKSSNPLTFEGDAPDKPGSYTLTTQWAESRRSHQQVKVGVAKKLSWTERIRASPKYPYGLLKVEQVVSVAVGPASQLVSDLSLRLEAVHPASPMLPELTWQLADCKANTHATLPQQVSAGGVVKFRASIMYRDQQGSSSAGDAGPLPSFAATGNACYEWSPDATCDSASFGLPEEGRRLSKEPCGLTDPQALQLQIAIISGYANIQPLCFSFAYSDDPASVGDFSQQLHIVQQLKPQLQEMSQAVAAQERLSRDAKAASAASRQPLAELLLEASGLGYNNPAIVQKVVQQKLDSLTSQVEGIQASFPSFLSPQSMQAGSLGHRLAIDLLYLTTDLGECTLLTLGLDTLNPQKPQDTHNHGSWPRGCLNEEEGRALTKGASAVLQRQLPAIVYDAELVILQDVQQQSPQSSYVPVSDSADAAYTCASAADHAAADGFLGYLGDAISIRPSGGGPDQQVSNGAIRNRLHCLCEGALVFRTAAQALQFANARNAREVKSCPPILALDRPAALLRLHGAICPRLPDVDSHPATEIRTDIAALGWDFSRLQQFDDAAKQVLHQKIAALQHLQTAEEKVSLSEANVARAEDKLRQWRAANAKDLENAEAALRKRKSDAAAGEHASKKGRR